MIGFLTSSKHGFLQIKDSFEYSIRIDLSESNFSSLQNDKKRQKKNKKKIFPGNLGSFVWIKNYYLIINEDATLQLVVNSKESNFITLFQSNYYNFPSFNENKNIQKYFSDSPFTKERIIFVQSKNHVRKLNKNYFFDISACEIEEKLKFKPVKIKFHAKQQKHAQKMTKFHSTLHPGYFYLLATSFSQDCYCHVDRFPIYPIYFASPTSKQIFPHYFADYPAEGERVVLADSIFNNLLNFYDLFKFSCGNNHIGNFCDSFSLHDAEMVQVQNNFAHIFCQILQVEKQENSLLIKTKKYLIFYNKFQFLDIFSNFFNENEKNKHNEDKNCGNSEIIYIYIRHAFLPAYDSSVMPSSNFELIYPSIPSLPGAYVFLFNFSSSLSPSFQLPYFSSNLYSSSSFHSFSSS